MTVQWSTNPGHRIRLFFSNRWSQTLAIIIGSLVIIERVRVNSFRYAKDDALCIHARLRHYPIDLGTTAEPTPLS